MEYVTLANIEDVISKWFDTGFDNEVPKSVENNLKKAYEFAVKELNKEYWKMNKKQTEDIMSEPIDFLELPTRTMYALMRSGIRTVGELCSKSYRDVYIIRDMGKRSLECLAEEMERYGLSFKEDN